jgi:PKD repeat protein
LTYTWDFGDGNGTSTETDPAYTYLDIGTYTVTLVATNTVSSDSIQHTVIVNPVEPINFTGATLTQATSNPIFPAIEVDFSADLLPDNATKPYTYTIDFGDGTVITDISDHDPLLLPHTYPSSGWYTVQISVWNAFMIDPVTDDLDVFVSYKVLLPVTNK